MPVQEKDHTKTKIKSIPPLTDMKIPRPEVSELPSSSYTQEEAMIVGRIKTLIGGDVENIVQTADEKRDKVVIPEGVIVRRKAIITEIKRLVDGILADRTKQIKTHKEEEFNVYIDMHLDEGDYAFLTQKPSGINVNGWGLFEGLLHPLEQGIKIGPPGDPETRYRSNWKSGR